MKKLLVLLLVLLTTLATMNPLTIHAATKISKCNAVMELDSTLKLKITGTNSTVKWSSSAPKIAKVSKKGVVTAKKTGSAIITATVGKSKYQCSVKVINSNHNIPYSMTAKEIIDKLANKIANITHVIVYDEETDPNHLLGRPTGYSSKVNFADDRVEQYDIEENPEGGTIEVYGSQELATERYNYIESVYMSYPNTRMYMYLEENIVFRLTYDLTPTQAEKIYNEFLNIINNE